MNPADASTTDPDRAREELVAYLDGELDVESSSRIEQLVATDTTYRDELVRLERVWGVLDHLPRATVDESFTRTTVEMVAVQVEQEVEKQKSAMPRRRLSRRLALATIVVSTAVIGYFSVMLMWPDPSRQLRRDLPVVQHVDAYTQVAEDEDFKEFLYRLQESGMFAEETSSDANSR
jgi:anti-sigma factor RsiW